VKLHELGPAEGATKKRKRIGRGRGSGHGKTSCRGQKGQNSRSGGGVRPGFEGGQMPLIRRVPKRGFTNPFKKEYQVVNVSALNKFADGDVLTLDILEKNGLIKSAEKLVKILGSGELLKKLDVSAHKFSKEAQSKITALEGTVQIVS